MKQACIRCVVQLSLKELRWKDEDGTDIHLDGPPVFVRACVLGQLQHCHLHKPSFPITVHQQLTFDRVLSNCKNPSMFKEVIRGEHVKIELIQITPDYKGGKILARFDCPAHKFLFPLSDSADMEEEEEEEEGEGPDNQRILVMNHSRNYKCPPELTYTSSTLLLEATVHSPLHILFPKPSVSDDASSDSQQDTLAVQPPSRRCRSRSPPKARHSPGKSPGKSRTARRLFEARPQSPDFDMMNQSLSAQERLHSLLSSYTEPEPEGEEEEGEGVWGRSSHRVKFKPPSSKSAMASPRPPYSKPEGPYYVSPTRLKGPHKWPECPRRSPEPLPGTGSSAPASPWDRDHPPSSHLLQSPAPCPPCREQKHEVHTVPNKVPLDVLIRAPRLDRLDPALFPPDCIPVAKKRESRPPFVVRHVEDSLLSKRNFCGRPLFKGKVSVVERHMEGGVGSRARSGGGGEGGRDRSQGGRGSRRNHAGGTAVGGDGVERGHLSTTGVGQRSPYGSPIHKSTTPAATATPTHPPSPPSAAVHGSPGSWGAGLEMGEELVDRYLPPPPHVPGGGGRGSGHDAGRLALTITEKIERLRQECCECLHSAESLGEDDLSEDLDRLRASLQGERDEALQRSSRMMPNKSSGSVKIGPRDYWSQRMAELTGKGHRVIFDETLKKIYNRLYTDASLRP